MIADRPLSSLADKINGKLIFLTAFALRTAYQHPSSLSASTTFAQKAYLAKGKETDQVRKEKSTWEIWSEKCHSDTHFHTLNRTWWVHFLQDLNRKHFQIKFITYWENYYYQSKSTDFRALFAYYLHDSFEIVLERER